MSGAHHFPKGGDLKICEEGGGGFIITKIRVHTKYRGGEGGKQNLRDKIC